MNFKIIPNKSESKPIKKESDRGGEFYNAFFKTF